MISDKCFGLEWINAKKQELRPVAPELLEKSIHALALLGHLVDSRLDFVFKGGTSLLLHLDPIRRLSIDIDILCGVPADQLDRVLQGIANKPPFLGYEEQDRGARGLPHRRHFKFFYASPTQRGQTLFILLDVVEESNLPAVLVQRPIVTRFIEVEREVMVTLPTIEGLLGDKLTAFAPNTTGVQFRPANGKPCDTMQVIKQLFDVGELFNAAQDMAAVSRSFDAAFALENEYRGGNFTREQVLLDIHDASLALTLYELRGAPEVADARLLVDGVGRLQSHVVQSRFRLDQARIAAGKAALIAAILARGVPVDINELRYQSTPEALSVLKQAQIALPAWQPINRIKGANPEAFYYWYKVEEHNRPS
jgi:hypothetical protein